jgi:hypothetical protein
MNENQVEVTPTYARQAASAETEMALDPCRCGVAGGWWNQDPQLETVRICRHVATHLWRRLVFATACYDFLLSPSRLELILLMQAVAVRHT